jgi:hypothetical protein
MTKKKTEKGTPNFDFHSIKTVEDACKKCGYETKLPDFSIFPEKLRHSLLCAYVLMIVFEAINDEWEPDFTNQREARYYPWPWVLSSGFGFSGSDYDYVFTDAFVGSRLCTNSSEKAIYILEQFEDIWKGWLLGMKTEIKISE